MTLLQFDDPVPLGLLLAGMAILGWVLLRRAYRRLGPREKNPPHLVTTPRPEAPASRGHCLGGPEDLVRWEVEMQELARELSAKLDSKMSALEALVREADRAAARLEVALRGDVPPALRPAESCREAIFVLADYGFSAADVASRLGVDRQGVERILAERDKTSSQ